MKIEQDKWVAIHYTLTDDDGQVLDSSVGGAPLGYVHGHGYLIVGLENELLGKEVGDKFSAVIGPKDAYGEYDERMVVNVPVEQFAIDIPIEVGMAFQMMSPGGPIIVRAVEVTDKFVKVDGNHELAGKTLHFDVEVVEVRDATEDELNPKGCGGCGGGCGGNCGGDCDCGGECDGNCDCGDGGCGGEGCGNCGN